MKVEKQDRTIGFGTQVPPNYALVSVYFLQLGLTANHAHSFYDYYQRRRWIAWGGRPIANWKKLAWSWIWVKGCGGKL